LWQVTAAVCGGHYSALAVLVTALGSLDDDNDITHTEALADLHSALEVAALLGDTRAVDCLLACAKLGYHRVEWEKLFTRAGWSGSLPLAHRLQSWLQVMGEGEGGAGEEGRGVVLECIRGALAVSAFPMVVRLWHHAQASDWFDPEGYEDVVPLADLMVGVGEGMLRA
jgi:hypothetical protein